MIIKRLHGMRGIGSERGGSHPQRTLASVIHCIKMSADRQNDALHLLNTFLREDKHYLASSRAYGDEGVPALKRAIRAFLDHPELGFIWLAYVGDEPAGVCVVSYAISTSIGGLVAKLDDVFVANHLQRQGIASEMLIALAEQLRREGVRRIDTSVYTQNYDAERYYEKLGFKTLGEERLALVL
jgi:GNAT superfamily N-acetyltransferase